MSLRAKDIVPITAARARLTELANDVVENGTEKVLTKNGEGFVALIDARMLDYYHELERASHHLVMADAAVRSLEQMARGEVIPEDVLLGVLRGK